jgi:hypothetical protein
MANPRQQYKYTIQEQQNILKALREITIKYYAAFWQWSNEHSCPSILDLGANHFMMGTLTSYLESNCKGVLQQVGYTIVKKNAGREDYRNAEYLFLTNGNWSSVLAKKQASAAKKPSAAASPPPAALFKKGEEKKQDSSSSGNSSQNIKPPRT